MSSLDDLAAFLFDRANGPDVSATDRGKALGLVSAWRSGGTPSETESAMRFAAVAFADHPDYRPEWRPAAQTDEKA